MLAGMRVLATSVVDDEASSVKYGLRRGLSIVGVSDS